MPSSHDKKTKALYFVALVPSGDLYDKGWELKNYMAEKYQTTAALKSPPHITLHMPFKWREDREKQLTNHLSSACNITAPFTLEVNGFGCFPPRVLFLDVNKPNELIQFREDIVEIIRKKLKITDSGRKNTGFTPHLTIAFRDLRKKDFHKAWEELGAQEIKYTFPVNAFSLLKHDGTQWIVHEEFPLKK
ncbi:MAG: 2'-5' RNA ligase family protein [Cyclobacteriaceae bacterium]|nr:2'-5' RNA ligase family protein [Cyclobacteriaceae bacterium]